MVLKKPAKKYSSVMLIDDSEIDNFINGKMLEGCNFAEHVFVHTSSKSALEFMQNIDQLKDVSQKLLPQVIFLDVNMPIMDGLQFLDELSKTRPSISSVCKIYLLTASQNPSDIERAKKNKLVTKIIQKPLNESILGSL
jgi:CheY-like chemotaxis protein